MSNDFRKVTCAEQRLLVWSLVKEIWPAFFSVLIVTFTTLAIGYFAGWDSFRFTGLVLHSLGTLAVWAGFVHREKHFNQIGWLRRLRMALNGRVPKNVGGGGVTFGALSLGGAGISLPVAANTTEERLTALEHAIDEMRSQASQGRKEIDSAVRWVGQALDEEKTARANAIGDLRRNLQDLLIGGIEIEKIGLILVFLGLLFAFLSEASDRDKIQTGRRLSDAHLFAQIPPGLSVECPNLSSPPYS